LRFVVLFLNGLDVLALIIVFHRLPPRPFQNFVWQVWSALPALSAFCHFLKVLRANNLEFRRKRIKTKRSHPAS
jgi:hypothetical protein